jgi:ABC-type antimicrobial peptide transport system permease subunit
MAGLLTHAVVRRTREIGVRMALGAHSRDVLLLIIGRGMKLAGLGILIGLVCALALTRLLQSQLYSISPTDPVTLLAVVVLASLIALFACWLPARRAARINPMEALRTE